MGQLGVNQGSLVYFHTTGETMTPLKQTQLTQDEKQKHIHFTRVKQAKLCQIFVHFFCPLFCPLFKIYINAPPLPPPPPPPPPPPRCPRMYGMHHDVIELMLRPLIFSIDNLRRTIVFLNNRIMFYIWGPEQVDWLKQYVHKRVPIITSACVLR